MAKPGSNTQNAEVHQYLVSQFDAVAFQVRLNSVTRLGTLGPSKIKVELVKLGVVHAQLGMTIL